MNEGGRDLWERLFNTRKLRLVMQSEIAECSLACLCMIASYHGQNWTLSELRRMFSVSSKGSTLQTTMDMADSLGLSARPLRVEIHELTELKTPCILHWDLRHYVVLVSATRNHIVVNDPARGERRLSYAQIDKSFTGIALEFTPTPKFEKKQATPGVRLGDLWTSMKGITQVWLQLGLLALAVQLFATLTPIINQLITDQAIAKADRPFLLTVSIGMIILISLQYLTTALQSFVGLYLGTQLSFQMKSNLLRHALRLPVSWFEKRHLGEILTRFSSLEVVQNFVVDAPVKLALNLMTLVIAAAMMIIYSFKLFLIIAFTTVIVTAIRTATIGYVRQKTDESITLGAQASTVFMETLRGARTFKQYAKERERVSFWQNDQISATNASFGLSRFNIVIDTFLHGLLGLQGALIWYFGALGVIDGALTLGMLFAFQAYVGQVSGASTTLLSVYFDAKTLSLHLDRLGDIIHENIEPGVDDPLNSKVLTGDISVMNISFRYGANEQYIYRDVSFDIKAGEFVAIMGRSGGGKSTLLKNLMWLMPPTDGEINLGGQSLQSIGLRNYRRQVGIVMQDDQLFQGTIADNVCFFDSDADVERIQKALGTACILGDILDMPMGMDTVVGDLGSSLSGGQAQRVLLARALYRDPKILLIDEGTSHLDPTTERMISLNLKKLKITRIVVSHRDEAVEGADRLFRVEGGQVYEIRREE